MTDRQMDEISRYLSGLFNGDGTVKPGVHHITVYHDDDCPKLRGGECSCQPDVKPGVPTRGK